MENNENKLYFDVKYNDGIEPLSDTILTFYDECKCISIGCDFIPNHKVTLEEEKTGKIVITEYLCSHHYSEGMLEQLKKLNKSYNDGLIIKVDGKKV